MFEQEVELEKSQSSTVPLLLIVALILAIVGVAGYFIWQNTRVLSMQEASTLVSQTLQQRGPVVIEVHAGNLVSNVNLKPHDPNYVLLEKAGLLKVGRDKGRITPVQLTSKGQHLLMESAGMKKIHEPDGTDVYTVPIAQRRLLEVSKVTNNSPTRATVEYTWQWEPSSFGEMFDASGSLVQSFNTWDRATLIKKYGADFYHANPTKSLLVLSKGDTGWQIAED